MADERRNERRLKWLGQTLDKKTFDIEMDHAAMRQANQFLELIGFRARLVFGHGMETRFELRGDPNPLDRQNAFPVNRVPPNDNIGHGANINANYPLANVNIGHEAGADNLGPVKIEAPEPEPNNAPYYGPPVKRPKNIRTNPFARIETSSSEDDLIFDDPIPAKKKVITRKRPSKGNVASDSKKSKTEFEGIDFGSKIMDLVNNLQNKDKKKKKVKKEFGVVDLNGPKKNFKRKRDRDDDDNSCGGGLGLSGSKRSRGTGCVF